MSATTNVYKTVPAEEFATFGASHVGYIKTVRSEEIASRYPGAPALAPGAQVFVLHAADGSPIAMGVSRASAILIAAEHQIVATSMH